MEEQASETGANIVFLHHSTGNNVWKGGVPEWFNGYNSQKGTSYRITERAFPSGDPYAWKNYPFDYWNIWVNNAGPEPYMTEPTLEMLTPEYDVIVFKHCYPVSQILEDTGSPDIASEDKRIENYKLQYAAILRKSCTSSRMSNSSSGPARRWSRRKYQPRKRRPGPGIFHLGQERVGPAGG